MSNSLRELLWSGRALRTVTAMGSLAPIKRLDTGRDPVAQGEWRARGVHCDSRSESHTRPLGRRPLSDGCFGCQMVDVSGRLTTARRAGVPGLTDLRDAVLDNVGSTVAQTGRPVGAQHCQGGHPRRARRGEGAWKLLCSHRSRSPGPCRAPAGSALGRGRDERAHSRGAARPHSREGRGSSVFDEFGLGRGRGRGIQHPASSI
jgi:hypothetical protein